MDCFVCGSEKSEAVGKGRVFTTTPFSIYGEITQTSTNENRSTSQLVPSDPTLSVNYTAMGEPPRIVFLFCKLRPRFENDQ